MNFDRNVEKLEKKALVNITRKFVEEILKENDSSHDMYHIERVVVNSMKISKYELDDTSSSFEHQLELIYISALLHDVGDRKYAKVNEKSGEEMISEFLESNGYEYVKEVLMTLKNISFSSELEHKDELKIESKIVQDADRLDAIGAIGISRCFCYAGHKKHQIYNPEIKVRENLSAEEYKKPSTAINHFYEKLFKLKDMIKTKTGLKMAEKRHKIMQDFVENFLSEWNCKI